MVNLRKTNKYELGKTLIPQKIYKLEIKKELELVYQKLYFNNVNYIIITNIFFLAALLSIIIYVLSYGLVIDFFGEYLRKGIISKYLTIFSTYFVTNLLVYYGLLIGYFLYNDSKFKKIENDLEKNLPEFIDNLVSNLKGGISLEKALLKSVRPEQISLVREVTLINEKIMMGKDVVTALREFRQRFSSPVINRTFFLIEEGLKGGGNLATPLERISQNLKRIYQLDEEIKSSSGGFAVVIRGITLIVAPLLFALALTLLSFIGDLFELLSNSGSQLGFVTTLPPEFSTYLLNFSYAMIVLITLFSSLITSQLKNEKTYTALKYLPIYVLVSLLLFDFISSLMLGFFGSILG